MTRDEGIKFLIAQKYRLESEMDLLRRTLPDSALILTWEEDQVVSTRLDRNGLSCMTYPATVIQKALSMFDEAATMRQDNGLQYTMLIVHHKESGLLVPSMVTWDDNEKIAMVVFYDDDILVFDEHL